MKKILIIEDEKALAEALSAKLEGNNFLILKAENGQAGLDLAIKEKPDLILLDLMMPVMDGMAMLKKLRTDSWGVAVPVIIMTNLSENTKTAAALEFDVHDYLVKSDWTLEDIVKKVKDMLD